MTEAEGTVFIVDDDDGIRKALGNLCESAGWRVKSFGSAREFLEYGVPERPGCLLLDVSMPELSGLDLQAELATRQIQIPVVFITGHGDIPTSVKAMKAGAMDFLTKPFQDGDLVSVVREGIGRDARQRLLEAEREATRLRLESLTARERQVFELVIKGMLNKQIAMELRASEQTIKVHRRRVMRKMKVESVADLVQAAVKIGTLKP